MKHLKIVTNVGVAHELQNVIDALKEEYENLLVEDLLISEINKRDKAIKEIALIVSKCAPDVTKLFFSDKAMETGSFDSSKIYQGEDFDHCEIVSADIYASVGTLGVELYDEEENYLTTCKTAEQLVSFVQDLEQDCYVYYNNSSINLSQLEEEELTKLSKELYE